MIDWDNLPEPEDYDDYCEPEKRLGAYIGGKWVDIEDLPPGYGCSPDWWDDDGFGETYEQYLEHTD